MTVLTIDRIDEAKAIAERPRIIEMVGIGGAGKSTLLKALAKRNGKIQTLPVPSKIQYLPVIAKIAFVWLPLYLGKYRHSRWFTLEEIRIIGYLETWLSYIRSQALAKDLVVVLDPGSVYWLSALQEFGPELTKDRRFQRWWENKLNEWSSALDMIIWLEAPNEMLLQRVLSRNEWHEAKYQSPQVALEYFERFRVWYKRLVPEMASRKNTKVFHYHTDQVSTEQMAEQIFSAVDLNAH
jgi:shikimate kinase